MPVIVSDDWFRVHGWTEYTACFVRDYFSVTFVWYRNNGVMVFASRSVLEEWAVAAISNNDPVALHAAWEAEQKRRETPLDPDGWTHFPGCSIHLAGGYRINQWNSGEFGAYKLPHKLIDGTNFKTLEEAVAACNRHAKENGVKSC